MSSYLNIAQVAANVNVLGFGNRAGVWTQGCHIGCPGCSSVHTHDSAAGRLIEPEQIIAWLQAGGFAIDGLTISGGEPSEQEQGVLSLITAFRAVFQNADVLLYSGLPWQRLATRHPKLVEAADIVVAGPFVQNLPALPLRGSSNQTIELLSDLARQRYADLDQWPIHTNQVAFEERQVRTVGIPNIERLSAQLPDKIVNKANASWVCSNEHKIRRRINQ